MFAKVHHHCGDSAYCGSFKECNDCANNDCPIHVNFSICGVHETETDIFYSSFFRWPSLDYEVNVVDVDFKRY